MIVKTVGDNVHCLTLGDGCEDCRKQCTLLGLRIDHRAQLGFFPSQKVRKEFWTYNARTETGLTVDIGIMNSHFGMSLIHINLISEKETRFLPTSPSPEANPLFYSFRIIIQYFICIRDSLYSTCLSSLHLPIVGFQLLPATWCSYCSLQLRTLYELETLLSFDLIFEVACMNTGITNLNIFLLLIYLL